MPHMEYDTRGGQSSVFHEELGRDHSACVGGSATSFQTGGSARCGGRSRVATRRALWEGEFDRVFR